MAQLHVFVSHSSQDKPFADALVHALRQAGADVWHDEHNLGADHLTDDIQAELSARPVFVVVVSKLAFTSDRVRLETDWAWNLSRREPQRILLPVVASPITPPSATKGPVDLPHLQAEAIAQTLQHLGLTPAGQSAAATAPERAADADRLVALGRAFVALRHYDLAVPFFQLATVLDSSTFNGWASLGYVQCERQQWLDALAALEQALAIRPGDADTWCVKGNALYSLNRDAEALVALEQALALDPNLEAAWNSKGAALNHLGRHEESLVALERALALDPNDTDAWYNKGNALSSLERYEEALVAYEPGFDANDARDWNTKGWVLYHLTRHKEALAAYERALALDANYALAYRNKAITLRALGRIPEAEDADRRAKKLGG